MEGETRTVSDCSGLIKAQTITVLVVDDDTTCLSIVAAKLKKFQYQVATVKHPNDALCTLRIKGDAFDLVVSDVHMPDMNGIQLQQVIAREFNLPVVLMSADGEEDVVLEGLESGAAFYIVKPVSTDDLKDLWQFAMTKKKKSHVVIEESAGSYPQEIINKTSTSDENEIAGSAASVNEARHDHYKDSKRKSPKKEGSSGESSQTASQKKQKVVWTNSLHNRFLEAIRSIGLDRAVPKKILEVMNVASLTRENVASHLQKYRIFLRRVTDEASLKLECSDKLSPIFTPSSSSRSSPSTLFLNNLTRTHNQNPENFLGARNAFFLNQEGSSSYLLGQSRLLSNRGTMLNPKVVGTNQTADNESVRLVQNIYQNTTSVQGNISRALSPNFDPLVLDSTTGVNSETADYNSYKNDGINIPNFTSLSSTSSKDSALHTNYVGLKIWNIQHLLVEKQPACDGRISNLASDLELQNSSSVGIGPGPNESPAINVDQIGGDQLWDDVLAAKCQMLVHSNVYKVKGNGLGESTHDYSAAYSYSPMFDLDELTNLPLDQECNLNPNIPTSIDQVVNVQNQVQDYNNGSSFDQALNERDDDEFLESLLATGPGLFEENHNLEGI